MENEENSKGNKFFNEGISLVIPAYHEKERISQSLNKYIPILESTGLKYEILVLIDGNDGTEAKLNGIKNLSYYQSKSRMGKGGAVKKGFLLSNFSYIGYVDADGSLSENDFREMLNKIRYNDCVIASRYLKDSIWINREPLFNRILSRGFNFLINSILKLHVNDTQCGAKFFSREAISKISQEICVRNRTFDVSILYHVKRAGFSIKEMPVTWNHDENSNMPIKAAIFPMFLTILAIKLMNSRIKHRVPKILNRVVSKFQFY